MLAQLVGEQSQEEAAKSRLVLGRMFRAFDTNQDGFVDHSELVAALSVLCQGSGQNKASAHF